MSQAAWLSGKPGKREACEARAAEALRSGCSVVIDRTNLTADQREHWLNVARAAAAPAHAIALRPPREEMERRVRGRTGHPGGVQGESGARFVARSLASFAPPAY
eukprot:CAMPEP_0185495592 /NCGR_PEP_ID=MMETSP1366-20130426/17695_1 /TAXON_ID=38817 /ORGANISM="Gephyrocapsa oceanica, Strain RCC1303" /LENGTH=104 /DNA_ID=CAMNT_0028104619 /DNA_START=25 /DNA_END=337 /DNA_ORIENTATION=-